MAVLSGSCYSAVPVPVPFMSRVHTTPILAVLTGLRTQNHEAKSAEVFEVWSRPSGLNSRPSDERRSSLKQWGGGRQEHRRLYYRGGRAGRAGWAGHGMGGVGGAHRLIRGLTAHHTGSALQGWAGQVGGAVWVVYTG